MKKVIVGVCVALVLLAAVGAVLAFALPDDNAANPQNWVVSKDIIEGKEYTVDFSKYEDKEEGMDYSKLVCKAYVINNGIGVMSTAYDKEAEQLSVFTWKKVGDTYVVVDEDHTGLSFTFDNKTGVISIVKDLGCQHEYNDNEICKFCNKVGEDHEHSGGTATCTGKATCATCGAEYGTATGHHFVDGICDKCQAADPDYDNGSTDPNEDEGRSTSDPYPFE